MCDMFFDTMTIIPENMHIFRYEIQNGAEDALQDCLFWNILANWFRLNEILGKK